PQPADSDHGKPASETGRLVAKRWLVIVHPLPSNVFHRVLLPVMANQLIAPEVSGERVDGPATPDSDAGGQRRDFLGDTRGQCHVKDILRVDAASARVSQVVGDHTERFANGVEAPELNLVAENLQQSAFGATGECTGGGTGVSRHVLDPPVHRGALVMSQVVVVARVPQDGSARCQTEAWVAGLCCARI